MSIVASVASIEHENHSRHLQPRNAPRELHFPTGTTLIVAIIGGTVTVMILAAWITYWFLHHRRAEREYEAPPSQIS